MCVGLKPHQDMDRADPHAHIHMAVAMYSAARGMRVHAVDPLEVNVERMRESRCINGKTQCERAKSELPSGGAEAPACSTPKNWANFSDDRVRVHACL